MKSETRLVARVNEDLHNLVTSAADLMGASMSQFLIEAAVEKANRVIEERTRLNLTINDAKTFLETLERPAAPNTKLLNAAKRYREQGLHENKNSTHHKAT